jgi:hypothetical protein
MWTYSNAFGKKSSLVFGRWSLAKATSPGLVGTPILSAWTPRACPAKSSGSIPCKQFVGVDERPIRLRSGPRNTYRISSILSNATFAQYFTSSFTLI